MEAMKFILVLLIAVFAVEAMRLHQEQSHQKSVNLSFSEKAHRMRQFKNFETKYNRKYKSEAERQHRFMIFVENMHKIEELTSKFESKANFGITKFADMTTEEFKKARLGLRIRDDNDDDDVDNHGLEKAEIPDVEIPDDFNWLGRNVVTRVKDQGNCGSCYAFSVTGVVESAFAIKEKDLTELSEQQIVDCDQYDDGCDGGDMANVYKAIIEEGGLETENDYPYNATKSNCSLDANEEKYQIEKGLDLSGNETNIAKYIFKKGPVSIGINALFLQFYGSGILDLPDFICWPTYLDHAMLIVGFGTDYDDDGNAQPFWIVKNSWGEDWGEQGYARVARGQGTCGINKYVTTAIASKVNEPDDDDDDN